MKISPCGLGASQMLFPKSQQSGMPDSMVAVGQYSELYAPVAG